MASQTTGPSLTNEPESTARVYWALACLMADVAHCPVGDDLPEPWNEIVRALNDLPVEKRFERLGTELEGMAHVDTNAVLDRVFEIKPTNPTDEPTAANSFQFPPLCKGERGIGSSREGLTHSQPTGSATPISFQGPGNLVAGRDNPQIVPIGAFLKVQDDDLEWCVERLFPVTSASILAGPGGWGKSWMLLDLAVECARGGEWLGRFQANPMRVLYLDEESSGLLLRHRLRKVLRGKRLQGDDLDIHFAVGHGFSLNNPASVAQLSGLLEALQPGLVIVDSLIRVHSAEENSASEMSRVFAVVKDLIRRFGVTIVFADHQRKPGHITGNPELLLRGTSEKQAFVDCLLSMQRKDGNLIIEHSKSRFGEPVKPFVVHIEDPEPGATTVTCLGEAEGIRQAALEGETMDFLRSAIPEDEWVERKDLVEGAKETGISRRVLDDMLKALVGDGRMERDKRPPETGRGGNRAVYRWKSEGISFHVPKGPGTKSDSGNQMEINEL